MKTASKENCSIIDHKSAKFCCLIVAAGSGLRFGGRVPKQFLPLGARMVIDTSLDVLLNHPQCSGIVIVGREEDLPLLETIKARRSDKSPTPIQITIGSDTRSKSVQNGLASAKDFAADIVMIHDAARPGLTSDILDRLLAGLREHHGSAPALPVVDALKKTTDDGIESVDRASMYRIQTPQAFRADAIEHMYAGSDGSAVDDFDLASKSGLYLTLVDGDERLMKITYPEDIKRLEQILFANTQYVTRSGLGYDVHAFEPGNEVQLCGVAIPHDVKLKGHSDADVGWHALTDALLGAIAAGDIGDHFPPTDPQWKGAASEVFLSFAGEQISAMGGTIVNVDITLICEAPKVKPHREAMRLATAKVLNVDPGIISVKATTTEGLGFEGRREGIAAQAIASVMLPMQRTSDRA
tara:strand:+ start:27555 stop:28787 length:1233 start_codon:yes stop_codon:yes gene_type:complete